MEEMITKQLTFDPHPGRFDPCANCGRSESEHRWVCSGCGSSLSPGRCGCGAVHMPESCLRGCQAGAYLCCVVHTAA